MKQTLFSIFILASIISGNARAERWIAAATNAYQRFASLSVNQAWKQIRHCGLVRANAFDPRLPQPLIPATEAILNRRGQILAYSLDLSLTGYPPTYEFKNPNGGENHSVSYDAFKIAFRTPYGGTVAMANTVAVPGGHMVQYFCQGQPTTPDYFEACAKSLWVDAVSNQLCRFAN